MVVKDPVSLKYFRLTPEQAFLLRLLETPRSVDELKEQLQRSYPTIHVEVNEIQALLQDLHTKGLLASLRVGQSLRLCLRGEETKRKEILKAVSNPLYIRIPGWDADRFFAWAVSKLGWLFAPWFFGIALLFVGACVLFALDHYDDIRHKLPSVELFFSGDNLLVLWLTIAFTKVVHELGHGLACKRFGGECRETGLVFLVFSPTLYCDTSDSWRFPNKWHRILVAAAGMYFELMLSALCVVLWWISPQGVVQNICLNVFFVSSVSTILFNANPLLKFDGYYILSDLLEIPNLQVKATQALRSLIASVTMGIQIPHSPFLPNSNRGWFITYAVSAFVYRWIVMIGILGFMYQLLRPYRLEMVGLSIASVSLSTGFARQGKQWFDILRAPRKQPLDRKRMIGSSVIALAVVLVLLFVPVPWFIEAPCFAQPESHQNVFAVVPGVLEEIFVQPGQFVQKGTPLVRLHNDELLDRVEVIRLELETNKAKQRAARLLQDESLSDYVVERIHSLELELSNLERWLEQTTLRAPAEGWIVDAPSVAPESTSANQTLRTWTGTVLTSKNLGAFVEVQTQVCTIAPTNRFEIVMAIDQENAKRVREGMQVRIKLYGVPDQVVSSRIAKMSTQATRSCPPELSVAVGGPLTGEVSRDGELVLDRGMILASAPFPLPTTKVTSGIRGAARIHVSDSSIGSWLWNWAVTKVWFRI
ncbi:HlyD family efflux transporter periplasmic adaptor subunit [Pirellulaceae bacterium SH501]